LTDYIQPMFRVVDIGTIDPVKEIKEDNSFQGIVFNRALCALNTNRSQLKRSPYNYYICLSYT